MTDTIPDVSTPEKLLAYIVGHGVRSEAFGINYAARIVRGVAHMDAVLSDWWRDDRICAIDLLTLDVGDGHRCVSAQLSGVEDFTAGREMLDLTTEEYRLFGFDVELAHTMEHIAGYAQTKAYAVLTPLWHAVIRVRRGLPPVPPA